MPVYLRRFYWNALVEQKNKENKEMETYNKQVEKSLPKMPKTFKQ
jgi:hypothetical protein